MSLSSRERGEIKAHESKSKLGKSITKWLVNILFYCDLTGVLMGAFKGCV